MLGFRDLLLFYVVTGVSLRWIATAAGIGPSSLLIWFGAWLLFYVPLALSVIELSTRYPQEGGLYVWTQKAFGDRAGFLAGWLYWNSNLPYFPAVLYFAASNLLFLRGDWRQYSHSTSYFLYFSIGILALLTLLNLLGLDIAKWTHNVGAICMWVPAVIVVILGFVAWSKFGSATSFTPHSLVPGFRMQDVLLWSTFIFAFGGCETGSFLAGEIRDARKTIPRALLIAGATIAICYVLGTFSVLLALPSGQVGMLDGLVQAIDATGEKLGISGIAGLVAVMIAVSNVGAAGAFLAAAARLPFVAGMDGYLPKAFGKVSSRTGSPWVSVLSQGILGIVFVLMSQAGTTVRGAYQVLVDIGVITYMLPYLFLFASLIRLQKEPASRDVIRVPGRAAKFVAIVGCFTATLAIVLSLLPAVDEPRPWLAVGKVVGSSALLILVGWALFAAGKRRMQSSGGVQ